MQGLGFFVVVAVLVVVGATTLQCRTLQYVHTIEAVTESPSPPVASPIPSVPRLRDPRAVLVLDVSASMGGSDPLGFLQERVSLAGIGVSGP